MINVIITDDHSLIIDGVKTALTGVENIKVIGEALNADQLYKLLRNKIPDIILLDIKMPQTDGLEVLEVVKKQYPNSKVIMLTQFAEKRFIRASIKRGADGYLLKDCGKPKLVEAINMVYNGEEYFEYHTNSQQQEENASSFSKMEKDIICLFAKDNTVKQIAEILNRKESTIWTIKSRLLTKTGCETTQGMVAWAIHNGIID